MCYIVEIPGIGAVEFAFPSTAAAFAGALESVARRVAEGKLPQAAKQGEG